MIPVCIHNRFHLGDALCTAHLLRSLAKSNPDCPFWFFVNANIAGQINEAVEDLPNLSLFTFESDQWRSEQNRSIDGWKNAEGHWEKSRVRWNWAEHQLEHHAWTAKRLGFQSPFSYPTHLLFDYPALGPAVDRFPDHWTSEFLVVNSDPQSGQLTPMHHPNSGYLDQLVWKLGQRHSVMTTKPTKGALCTQSMGHSISTIGKVSLWCEHHVCIATGPWWPTLNVHNNHLWTPERKRIVILDNGERFDGLPWIQQVSRVEEAEEILKAANLL